MKDQLFEFKEGHTHYRVPKQYGPITGMVEVPGSKSVTNRALLMAALSEGQTTLTGVLFSDDSRHLLGSLITLGFDVEIHESKRSS